MSRTPSISALMPCTARRSSFLALNSRTDFRVFRKFLINIRLCLLFASFPLYTPFIILFFALLLNEEQGCATMKQKQGGMPCACRNNKTVPPGTKTAPRSFCPCRDQGKPRCFWNGSAACRSKGCIPKTYSPSHSAACRRMICAGVSAMRTALRFIPYTASAIS